MLTTKLKVSAKIAREAEQLLRQHYVEPVPDQPSEIQVRDEDDRWVLESALRAWAEILITEDKDLLDISDKVPELKIVTPRTFWELIQK